MRAASKSGNLTGADLPANLTPAVRFPVKGSRVADVIDSQERDATRRCDKLETYLLRIYERLCT